MLPAVIWPTHCSSSLKSQKVVMFLVTTKGTTSNPSSKPTNGPPATLFDCTGTGPIHTKSHRFQLDSFLHAANYSRSGKAAKALDPTSSHVQPFFLNRTHVTHNAAARKRSDVCLGSPARLKTPTRLTQFQHSHPPRLSWSPKIATDLFLRQYFWSQRPTTISTTKIAC